MRSIPDLAKEIRTLAGRINAADHQFLTLIAEFDRRTGWMADGMQTCAHWLNWKCGVAIGVARALENLPMVSAAMSSGRLSYSKAREITRVGNESNEDYLLQIAEHGTAAHDDGALRFVRPDGKAVDGGEPSGSQPAADWAQVPVATGEWRYHGDRMDLPLAVDLLIQSERRSKDVPAGTLRAEGA